METQISSLRETVRGLSKKIEKYEEREKSLENAIKKLPPEVRKEFGKAWEKAKTPVLTK